MVVGGASLEELVNGREVVVRGGDKVINGRM